MRNLAFVVAGCALLAGCGDSDPPKPAAAKPLTLDGSAKFLRTERVRLKIDMGFTVDGKDLTMSGTGVASPDPYAAKLELEQVTQVSGRTTFSLIKVGKRRWLASDDLRGRLPKGKRWIDETDVAGAPNALVPYDFLDFLTAAQHVKPAGKRELGGREVTILRGTVDMRTLDVADADKLRDVLTDEADPVPVEAWVDADGRPWRVQTTIHTGGTAVMRSAVEIVEYGVPADIEPPPAAQVAEASDVRVD
jgi:hypothetical protein